MGSIVDLESARAARMSERRGYDVGVIAGCVRVQVDRLLLPDEIDTLVNHLLSMADVARAEGRR